MRTTVTLDPDVARILDDEVHRTRQPFKTVLNDAIRRGFAPRGPGAKPQRYRVPVHAAQVVAGYDAGRMNALADELEDQAILAPKKA